MVLLVRLGLVGWRCHTNHCHPAADGSSGPHRSLLIQYPKQLPALFWAPPAVVSCVQRSLAPPVLTDPAGPVTTHGAQTPACLFIAHPTSIVVRAGRGWSPPHPQLPTFSIVWLPPLVSSEAAGFRLQRERTGLLAFLKRPGDPAHITPKLPGTTHSGPLPPWPAQAASRPCPGSRLHWFWCGEFQLLPGSLSKLFVT